MSGLKERFRKEITPEIMTRLNIKNIHRVPKLEKVVINTCLKEAIEDYKVLEKAVEELAQITGQRPIVIKSKRAVASFKLKKGVKIAAKVTLRGDRMYDFLERLINVTIPRIRDFKGIPKKSFDGRGNLTFGISEQIIFPEIYYDKVTKIIGMNITITTTAKNDEEGFTLLSLLGFPFMKQ